MTDTTSTRPQMGNELLPCPFCEGTHVVVCKNDMQHTAYCTDCEAEGPLALSQEDAITAWNRRASSQMGDEELREILAECVERASPKADRTALAIVAGEEIPGAAQITVKEALVAMSRVRASLPQPTMGSTGTGDSFISEALAWAANMRLAAVAGCNCGAKTHELSWHSVTCRFRALEEGAALLEEAASTPAQSVLVEARLLSAAKLLFANALACVEQHHGRDTASNGLPGWLADAKADIEASLSHAPSQAQAGMAKREFTDTESDSLAQVGYLLDRLPSDDTDADWTSLENGTIRHLYTMARRASPQPDRESERWFPICVTAGEILKDGRVGIKFVWPEEIGTKAPSVTAKANGPNYAIRRLSHSLTEADNG